MEEFIAEEEARNANAQEPGTYVDHKAEEFMKATKGVHSPLGEALLAFHKRWVAVHPRGSITASVNLRPDWRRCP